MYDVIIIGSGPAGYTAGIYCVRYNMKVLLIGKEKGGAISKAHKIDNWPGDLGISGVALMDKVSRHCSSLGVEIKNMNVTMLKKKGKNFLVSTDKGEFASKSLILAMGTERRSLGVEGEEKFAGKGVSYCFTCDAGFFKGKDVVVVGGGNASSMACELLSQYANKIYWLYRSKIKAVPSRVDNIRKTGKTKEIKGEISEIIGDRFVNGVKLKDGKSLKVDGVFVEIGATPSSVLCKEIGVKVNEFDYVIVDKKQMTNVKGVFACGDICDNVLKQMSVAVGEGAVAALGAYNYLK